MITSEGKGVYTCSTITHEGRVKSQASEKGMRCDNSAYFQTVQSKSLVYSIIIVQA